MPQVRELLNQSTAQSVIGRNQEIAHLLKTLSKKAPLVVHLHGIPGIGKTSLLEVFARRAREQKIAVIRLDCRLMEPTERGFLHQLSITLGRKALTLEKASEQLARLSRRVVLTLDNSKGSFLTDVKSGEWGIGGKSSDRPLCSVSRPFQNVSGNVGWLSITQGGSLKQRGGGIAVPFFTHGRLVFAFPFGLAWPPL